VSTRVVADGLEMRYSDAGCGIPPDVMGEVFEPPFSTRAFGIGSGMSIVKNIMQQHGSEVEIWQVMLNLVSNAARATAGEIERWAEGAGDRDATFHFTRHLV
jgi:signal transduction histidine kinase